MITETRPQAAASKIITELKIKHPNEIRVELIAQHLGATVSYARLRSAAGRLVRSGKRAIITIPDDVLNEGRRRFSIGHELGHFILSEDIVDYAMCSIHDMTDWQGKRKMETEANHFSGELLMPFDFFFPRCVRKKPNMNLIKELAGDFRTSLTATAVRYMHVTREPCALVYCIGGKIEWFIKKQTDFKYVIRSRGQEVDKESLAYASFQGNGSFDEGFSVPASAWVESDYLFNEDLEFIESTCYLPSLNATLTLLWEN